MPAKSGTNVVDAQIGARPVLRETTSSSKPFVDQIDAIALAAGRLGITPNGLTYISIVPAIGCGVAAAQGYFILAALLFALSGFCDLLDGPLARTTGQATKFGALLDSTIDRLADAAPFVGLVVFYGQTGWPAMIPATAILAGYTVSYVRARAEGLNISLPPLWMRRPERMILTGIALMLGGLSVQATALPSPITLGIVALIAVLSFAAAIHALIEAKRFLDRSERSVVKAGEPVDLMQVRQRYRRP